MRRLSVLALVALLVLAAVPAPVAADSRSGAAVIVEEGETVNDLTAYAGTVVVRGTVAGDVEAYGAAVVVAPGGTVEGRVRAYGGTVEIDGEVGGNVVVYGGTVSLGENAVVGGSFGAAAGQVTVAGTVKGDVTVGAGDIVLADTAVVTGDVVYDGHLTDDGAAVDGTVRKSSDLALAPSAGGPLAAAFSVYVLLADALLGALVLLAFPRFARASAETARADPLRTFGAGLGVAFAVPLALALVAVTIVGAPLALAGLLLLLVALWVGSVLGRYAVGSLVLSRTDVENRYAALLVGIALVAVAARIPFVGVGVRTVVLLLGTGTLALAAVATYEVVRGTPGGLTSL